MSATPRSSPPCTRRESIRVGALLAEGGEGRVFELPLQPHLVYKEHRRTVSRAHLEDLICWPESGDPEMLSRVHASASWPQSLVEIGPEGTGAGDASIGVLVARAPRRFALRHRDGSTRLATLSYLTADPAYREVAYGLALPQPFTPERLGLVYALARVLEAFETLEPRIGHGDLSAKNVLWSLQRGPEVFLIDCDNCERYGTDGSALSFEGRRRAMTPNWDDPAVPSGGNPELSSDRYSLALIFLRVVGAANFPVQARQRQGGEITIDFPIPPGYAREVLLGPGSPLWELCARGLSTGSVDLRPSPSEWVAALESVLDGVGATEVLRSVWATQGGGPSRLPTPPATARRGSSDVSVRPVVAASRPQPPPRRVVPIRQSSGRLVRVSGAATAFTGSPTPASAAASATGPGSLVVAAPETAPEPVLRQIAAAVVVAFAWWLNAHRSLFGKGRQQGPGVPTASAANGGGPDGRAAAGNILSRLALCAVVDLAVGLFGLFLVAMAVAPILGL